MKTARHDDVIVLGAGIQGTLAALLLAQHGRQVHLIDKNSKMLTASSLNYEGRIHTGMLYAMDHSFRTAERLATDALAFAPMIERLLEHPIDWENLRSESTQYYIHRDSHLSADQLIEFWTRLETKIGDDLSDPTLSYVGLRPKRLFKETAIPHNAAPGVITRAFETAEHCLDQVKFNRMIESAVLAHPLITVSLDHEIVALEDVNSSNHKVSLRDPTGHIEHRTANLVVNCLWEARAIFDAAVNMVDNFSESLRLKYSLLLKSNAYLRNLGSFMLTHGAYGGIVVTPNSDTVMISWYPASLGGLIPSQTLPADWAAQCAGQIPDQIVERVLQESVEGFRGIFPDFPDPELALMKAGVIVAHGLKDIDDRQSGFHQRDERPIQRQGSYISIATGKYGSAPRNTQLLEQELFG